MNLPILLFFGTLVIVYAIYKIPEHDTCILRVLLCDDFTKPLTPVDNSTLEMFKSIGQLNAVCDELSKFRICLKDAEIFCTENADLDVGFELLNNRRLAFDLCMHGSSHQHVYMMVEECVNNYSHSAIEFCTDKAVETVGLDFDLGDYERECRFLGAMQYCHIAVVTDQCGSIAGNMLEKLVVFRGERDFLCIAYENEKLKNLKAFYATMDSYVQQYRNMVHQIKMEDEAKRNDEVRKFETQTQEASNQFHSRISPLPEEDCVSDSDYTSNREEPLNSGMSHCAEKQPSSCLSDKRTSDSEKYLPQHTNQPIRRFYEQKTGKILSEKNYACKTKASFLLIEILSNGEHNHLGYGEADVLWATFSPLKYLSCGWLVNPTAPMPLARCSILIHNSLVPQESDERETGCDLPCNATIVVYETVNEKEMKRVASLRLRSFLKYSPSFEERFNSVINFFKNHAHDIRFWCSEQHEIYEEQNRVHFTGRTGFISYDDHNYGEKGEKSRISDQKRTFYRPEQFEYPVDTEIHLISSENANLENGLDVEDHYASQNPDDNLNIFLTDETLGGRNYEQSPPRLSEPSKSSHLYRPYELYRPRVGETLDAENSDISCEDDDETSFNPNEFSFEDSTKTSYKSHLHVEEMCPELSENISNLVNKPGRYSEKILRNIVNIRDEEKSYKKFSISKTGKDISSNNRILKAKGIGNIATDSKNFNKEIYAVTPSSKIETSIVPNRMMLEDTSEQNLDENSRIPYIEDDNQLFQVAQENFKDLVLEDITKSINDKSSRELIAEYQNDRRLFSDKHVDESTNHGVYSEDEFSPKSEIFSKRSNKQFSEEQLINVFKLLDEMKYGMKRILEIFNETGMIKLNKNQKFEL